MEHPHSSPTLRQRTHATSTTTASSSESSTTTPTTDEASSILSSSVQGASYLVLLQFVSRMLTFTLNQVLLRFTSAETLGIASVQLELLLNTILFLSREGVRCAAIRVSDDSSTTTTTTASSSLSSDADRIGDGSHGISDIKDETAPVSSLSSSSSSSSSITSTPRPGSEAYRLQKLVNMVYAPIPIGALMTVLAVGYCLSHVDSSAEARFPHYRLSIYLYGLSALIELLAEPMFMVAQYKLWFKTRVSVEGTAVIVRCVLTCALTIYGNRAEVVEAMPGHHHALHLDPKTTAAVVAAGKGDRNTMGVLAFAVAQFVYGLLTLGGFLLAFWSKSRERHEQERRRMEAAAKKYHAHPDMREEREEDLIEMRALLPKKLVRMGNSGRPEYFYFDPELLKLSKTLTAQSLLKHILTEGDKMLMAGLTNEEAQGVYAFVVNYGSLVARILFQPMEETSRTLFSRLLSDVGPASKSLATTTKEKNPSSYSSSSSSSRTGAEAKATSSGSTTLAEGQVANLILSRNLLLTIMKFHILLGLVFISFGTHYTATLIDLVVGKYWSRDTIAPQVLSLYCWYVPIMGLNGITEAVVQAVASETELGVLSYWMIGFSAVFCSTGAVLMGVFGMGAKGIVLANCVNLSMRIGWSMWFLSRYYGRYIPASTSEGEEQQQQQQQKKKSLMATFSNVPWRMILPRPSVLVAFTAAYAITAASELYVGWDQWLQKVVHLGTGVATFLAVAGVVFVAEKPFMREIQSFVRQRRN